MMKRASFLLRASGLTLIFTMSLLAAAWADMVGKQETPSRLRLVESTYSAFNKYEDMGVIEITYYENGEPIQNSLTRFSTRFVRSGNFEIQWERTMRGGGDGLLYKIWTSEGIALSQYGRDDPFQSSSLYDALSRAVGISNSITFYVPCLLMPSMGCSVCDQGIELAELDGSSADQHLERIDVKYPSESMETYWIDKKNNQVSQIEWWDQKESLRIHTKITYTIVSAE